MGFSSGRVQEASSSAMHGILVSPTRDRTASCFWKAILNHWTTRGKLSSTFLNAFVLGPRPTETEMNAACSQAGYVGRCAMPWYNVQGVRVWLFMEEKAVFGLDFIFQVAGAAHTKAL